MTRRRQDLVLGMPDQRRSPGSARKCAVVFPVHDEGRAPVVRKFWREVCDRQRMEDLCDRFCIEPVAALYKARQQITADRAVGPGPRDAIAEVALVLVGE